MTKNSADHEKHIQENFFYDSGAFVSSGCEAEKAQ